jgi:hypothetical protein
VLAAAVGCGTRSDLLDPSAYGPVDGGHAGSAGSAVGGVGGSSGGGAVAGTVSVGGAAAIGGGGTGGQCRDGEARSCACPGGPYGQQYCENGFWGPCACSGVGGFGGMPTECYPGEVTSCYCPDGSYGEQRCYDQGYWGPCECYGSGGAGGIGGGTSIIQCGNVICEGLMIPVLNIEMPPCCPSDGKDLCGLDVSLLGQIGINFSEPCQAKHQPGHLDPSCPTLDISNPSIPIPVTLPGCCRTETATCGAWANDIAGFINPELGCVDPAPLLDGGPPQPCMP